MAKFKVPGSIGPERYTWVVEYKRRPEDDEGMQTLYGPFKDYEVAAQFGKQHFGMKRGKTNRWHLRSIWPVEIKD
jgi:hypothetical protein